MKMILAGLFAVSATAVPFAAAARRSPTRRPSSSSAGTIIRNIAANTVLKRQPYVRAWTGTATTCQRAAWTLWCATVMSARPRWTAASA